MSSKDISRLQFPQNEEGLKECIETPGENTDKEQQQNDENTPNDDEMESPTEEQTPTTNQYIDQEISLKKIEPKINSMSEQKTNKQQIFRNQSAPNNQ